MLTASFLRHLELKLGEKTGARLHVRRTSPVSGGCINMAARLDTTSGSYFLKVNDAFSYPQMFEKEASGLTLLRNSNTLPVPEVILTGEEGALAYIILSFVESKPIAPGFWEKFGRKLAQLHRNSSKHFGLHENNYIGSLGQINNEHENWIDFFIGERLNRQLKLALSAGRMNDADAGKFEKLYDILHEVIPDEKPALLHGDLWNGNFMTGSDGFPLLIDPAVYYGHREMDLAMTKLFGGFDDLFYEAYHDEFPLVAGFEERLDIHNLYPLMVHVNLFGGSYANQVKGILKKFI